ncbi:MAG: DNA mismatch endonuclease Vsr [Gemmatimonadales bacterium]|nr:DNA mismatch endonuclease Vsr [Gemmatimonadales bacterium]
MALRTTHARSQLMSAVRRSGTVPELLVRRLLTAVGLRYRLNVRGLPGTPDIVNQRRHLIVFVHGCFWHRHRGCRLTTSPKRNRVFWSSKFAANIARDNRNHAALRRLGFTVVTVWQCETANPGKLSRRLVRLLGDRHHRAAAD